MSEWQKVAEDLGRKIAAVEAERDEAHDALTEARKTVVAYYEDHDIEECQSCPCKCCDMARAVFQAQLLETRQAARAQSNVEPTT